MRKWIFFLMSLVLMASVLGCSSSRTFLDDFMILGGTSLTQIDEYFDLNEQQRQSLDKDMAADLDRLRRERFARMAMTLRRIEREAYAPNGRVLSQAFVDLKKEYKVDSSYFRTSAGKFIATLPREQILRFKKKVEAELAQDHRDPQKIEKRNGELESRYKMALEFWAGELSELQQKLLKDFLQKNSFPWKERDKNRKHILAHFMKFQSDSQKLRRFSEDFVADADSQKLPEYLQALAAYDRRFQEFLDELWRSLTSSQKERLHRNLLARADKLDELASRPWQWK